MRTIIVFLLVIAVFAFAGDNCGNNCGASKGCCGSKAGCGPDWGYAYNDAHYIPDCSPQPMRVFHEKLIPMIEARKSNESAYIREYADQLYRASKQVPGSLKACDRSIRKAYNQAAKNLVRNCKQLRHLAYGGATWELYNQVREIEADMIQLANLADS